MKTPIIFLSIFILNISSCTKDGFMTPDFTNHFSPTTASVDNIDVNLLVTGAKINLYINEKDEVNASFDFPKPNTDQVVSWWYEWSYITTQTDGIKTCTDKTLKFIACCDSYVLLKIQCTKPDGMKSEIRMTSAKVNLVIHPKQKKAKLN